MLMRFTRDYQLNYPLSNRQLKMRSIDQATAAKANILFSAAATCVGRSNKSGSRAAK